MGKTLIAFFSASGVTKKISEKLSKVNNADLFEIIPKEVYSKHDLNWLNPFSRTTKEKNNPEFRPEILNEISNFDEYDKIILGFPVWWYKAPNIIYTFLDSYNFNNKVIIPFCTSGQTGIEKCVDKLKENYKEYDFENGIRLTLSSNEDEIKTWLNN